MALSQHWRVGPAETCRVQEPDLGVTQKLTSQSTLDKEHTVRSVGAGLEPGPTSHYQGTVGESLHSFSLSPHLVIGPASATHAHYSAPTQAGGGAGRQQWGRGVEVLPGFVEVFACVGHPASGPKALAQGAGGHIGESLFLS